MKKMIFAVLAAGGVGLVATDSAQADHRRSRGGSSFGLQILGDRFGFSIGNRGIVPRRSWGNSFHRRGSHIHRGFPNRGAWGRSRHNHGSHRHMHRGRRGHNHGHPGRRGHGRRGHGHRH